MPLDVEHAQLLSAAISWSSSQRLSVTAIPTDQPGVPAPDAARRRAPSALWPPPSGRIVSPVFGQPNPLPPSDSGGGTLAATGW